MGSTPGVRIEAQLGSRLRGRRCGHQVEMPARVQPLPVTSNEDLSETAPHRALRTSCVKHHLEAPVEHDDIAIPLRLRFWKRQAYQSTTSFTKRSRGIKYLSPIRERRVVQFVSLGRAASRSGP